jgi:hypothetical protein
MFLQLIYVVEHIGFRKSAADDGNQNKVIRRLFNKLIDTNHDFLIDEPALPKPQLLLRSDYHQLN